MGRREQAQASRAALLAAARACFTEHGYEATTVAAILDRAGMARGALYHYFPEGKAEIFTAVFDLVDAEYHARRDAFLALSSAEERLEAGAGAFLERCADESFARIVLADAPAVVPGQDQPGSSFRLLREQLADAIAAGEVRALDLQTLAVALYGAIRAAGEHISASGGSEASIRVATATIAALVDGLRPAQNT